MPRTPKPDPLRDAIRQRAEQLGWQPRRPRGRPSRTAVGLLTNAEISRRCGGRPTADVVGHYLHGRLAIKSRYVTAILTALGWDGTLGWVDPPPTAG